MPPKKKTLAETLAELRTKDKLQIGPLSGFNLRPKGLSTGNIALDFLTGVGGYPEGGIVEQFGPPSSGKTTSVLQALAQQQKKILSGDAKGYVGFWDYEKSLDEGYCKALGLDTDHESFIYLQPTSFEHGANIYRKLLDSGEITMAAFDSVAAMVTENELSADTGSAKVADRAKMMHQFLRQVNDPIHRTRTSLIFLNHTMKVVDASPMGAKMAARGITRMTQPGGVALGFYSALRIEFKQIGNIRTSEYDPLSDSKEDQIRQQKIQATIVKNKVGDPFGTAVLRVRWGRGFSQAFSVLGVLTAYGLVKKDGAGIHTFSPDLLTPERLAAMEKKKLPELKIRGEEQTLSQVEDDPQWLAQLEVVARGLLDQHGVERVSANKYDSNGNEREMSSEDLDALLSVDMETGEVL